TGTWRETERTLAGGTWTPVEITGYRLRGRISPRNSREPCACPDCVSGKPPRSARIGRRCVGNVVTWPLGNMDSCATRAVDSSPRPASGRITREQLTGWQLRRFKQRVSARLRATYQMVIPNVSIFESLKWLEEGKRPIDWNGPTKRIFHKFHHKDLERPIIDHFECVTRRHRNRIAITDSDTSLSFGAVWDGLSGLADIIAAETKRGDLIGISLPTCSLFPIAILACLAAGRPFVALDSHYPADWLGQVLDDARPALIIGPELVLRGIEAGARKDRHGLQPAKLDVDEPVCLFLTSGSPGRPKGIVNSQRGLLQRVAQSINAAHINASDRFLTLASLCTIVGVRDTLTALVAGASIHLIDPQRVGARETLNMISEETIT